MGGYDGRICREIARLCEQIGISMCMQSRESCQSEGLDEKACGVGTKEKDKDNGYTGVQEIWVKFAIMLVRLRVLGDKNREGGLSGVG